MVLDKTYLLVIVIEIIALTTLFAQTTVSDHIIIIESNDEKSVRAVEFASSPESMHYSQQIYHNLQLKQGHVQSRRLLWAAVSTSLVIDTATEKTR